MTENFDTHLQSLFADVKSELEDDTFVNAVMARTRFLKYRLPFLLGGIALVIVVCALLLSPSLKNFGLVIAWGMTTSLVDLGDGWLAWFITPVNTVGSLLILIVKVINTARKKLLGASFRF